MTTTVFLATSHCRQVIYPFSVIYGIRVVCHPIADVEHHRQLFPTWMVMWHVCSHGWMSHSMMWPRPRTWLCESAADMACVA
jgi:hypothetical protein